MTIAILAHDSRKELALQFCTAYSAILSRNNVIATGTTGRMLAQTTGLPVHCYLSGKLGGVQQITSRVACDEVDLVLFFRDPLKADAASLTEQNLLRLCDMHSVPIATNIGLMNKIPGLQVIQYNLRHLFLYILSFHNLCLLEHLYIYRSRRTG